MAKRKYIDEFWLTNIKGIRNLSAKVSGKHFALCGKNELGKTTIFQMILRLIAAMPDALKPDVWVTTGADSAEMKIKLGIGGEVYYVQEKIMKSRSRVRMWQEIDGKLLEITPAQATLKKMFGTVMDLSPLRDMEGKEQLKFLSKTLPKLAEATAGYVANRKTLNTVRSSFKYKKQMIDAILKDVGVSDDDMGIYKEEKDITALMDKKVDVQPLELKKQQLEVGIELYKKGHLRFTEIDEEIKKLQEEKARLLDTLKGEPAKREQLTKLIADIKTTSEENARLDEEIKTVSDHNMMHKQVVYAIAKIDELAEVKKSVEEYDGKITELDESFRAGLAALPFDKIEKGLELRYNPEDDDNKEVAGLFLNGLPFHRSQQSTGVMIKCLIKMAIEVNPDGLNFIYIDDWEKLDTGNKDELLKWIDKQGGNVQLGIEKVDDRTEIAVEFIEIKEREKKPKK